MKPHKPIFTVSDWGKMSLAARRVSQPREFKLQYIIHKMKRIG